MIIPWDGVYIVIFVASFFVLPTAILYCLVKYEKVCYTSQLSKEEIKP